MFPDAAGLLGTYSATGPLDTRGAFFQSLGSNGRSCGTCHDPGQAMSLSPPDIRRRYASTRGQDPLFASVDGANCPDVQRSDRNGHSLLLGFGLIRIALAVPPNPQFSISVVHDPYGCALATDPATGEVTVSVYRRPLPAANLNFLSAVMWDGRETIAPLSSGSTFAAGLDTDLGHQALDAITGHAQAKTLPGAAELEQIVHFELGLFSAQAVDRAAGSLSARGALGGPVTLGAQEYYPGINDSLGGDPSGGAFDGAAMQVFASWSNAGINRRDRNEDGNAWARRDIAAGELIFNTAQLTITGVRGLNDNSALGRPASIKGTCTTCHDTPDVGNHSLPLPLDIGVAHPTLANFEPDHGLADALQRLQSPDLPIFRIDGCPDPFHPGASMPQYTSDPGRALITGQCADLNRLKGPILRGLSGRPPYFHNGAAANLEVLVDFYNERFDMHLTRAQKGQLVAFLSSL